MTGSKEGSYRRRSRDSRKPRKPNKSIFRQGHLSDGWSVYHPSMICVILRRSSRMSALSNQPAAAGEGDIIDDQASPNLQHCILAISKE